MNGRLYDPVLRTFLMPDNFVQQPENTQNYNRYAYVLNNPLRYTDPSGEVFDPVSLYIAVAIGAAISGAFYAINCMTSSQGFSWSALGGQMLIGAASAAVTFGIGSAATSSFTNFYSQAAFQAAAHGTFQGVMSEINGGSFIQGFAAGALSSIAASAWSGGSTTTTSWKGGLSDGAGFVTETTVHAGLGAGIGTIGMIAFGTVMGGAGAALTGGNFWQGAITGLVVSGLNHAMHSIDPPGGKGKKAPSLKEANKFYNKNKNSKTVYEVDASTVDLDFVNTSDWIPGTTYEVNTLYSSKQGKVFGKLALTYKGNNQVSIQDNRYDFNTENYGCGGPCCIAANPKIVIRNILTWVGDQYAGNGTSFMFRFNGTNTIKYSPPTVTDSRNGLF